MKDNGSMKSEKLKAFAKAVWQFCSYVFWPQWEKKEIIE